MGRAFTAIGIVALIVAFAWWQTFYGASGPKNQRMMRAFWSGWSWVRGLEGRNDDRATELGPGPDHDRRVIGLQSENVFLHTEPAECVGVNRRQPRSRQDFCSKEEALSKASQHETTREQVA
jgi:hypothetical protein